LSFQCKFSSSPAGCPKPDCPYVHPPHNTRRRGIKRSQSDTQSAEKRQRADDELTEVILFPDAETGKLIGNKGSTLREIKDKCAAFIQISAQGHVVNGDQREVTLTGTQEAIKEAKQELNEVVNHYNIPFKGFEEIRRSLLPLPGTKGLEVANEESSEEIVTVTTNFGMLDDSFDNDVDEIPFDDPGPSRSDGCDRYHRGELSKSR
jgi:polyribonucleotide nucleotidyltransferase